MAIHKNLRYEPGTKDRSDMDVSSFLDDILDLTRKHKHLPADIRITLLKTAIAHYKREKKKERLLKKVIGKIAVETYKINLN